jgi:class 3 adenylate cyclase
MALSIAPAGLAAQRASRGRRTDSRIRRLHGRVQIETRYARRGDATIAWTTAGDGPTDLLFVPGFISHVEHLWEQPGLAGFFERLMGFSRLLIMDRRGCGLSDPRTEALSLEDEARDVLAVLDAAGSERAVLMGYTTGGLLAIATAALAPERVQAIVLYASMARTLANDDVDWTFDEDGRREMWARLAEVWGTGANLAQLAPSRADEPRMKAWLARMERLSSSPGELLRLMNATGDHDITHLLGELRVPTLILHRTGDRLIDVRHSRYLAERIPGARFVELEGVDNLPGAVDSSDILGEIEEFLTGGRSRTVARELLTVIFSDIVGSTGHAARMGDAPWRDLLGAHQTAVRREIERFGGREVKTIGDAFLIAFDGAPSHAVRCAEAIVGAVDALGLEVRVGLHTGECEVMGGDVGGMAVHIAARVAGLAAPGEVLASGTTYGTVVGAGLRFEDRGMQVLKGVPGHWPLFALHAV